MCIVVVVSVRRRRSSSSLSWASSFAAFRLAMTFDGRNLSKGVREGARKESAHGSYIGPRCSRTLPRVVLACSPFVYLETHSRCRFVSFRKGSSSAVAAAKADRPLSHESRSSFPGGIGRETNRLVSPTMVLKRLIILLPVLAHSPFVPRGAKGSCVAFQFPSVPLSQESRHRARPSLSQESRRARR